MRKDKVLTRNSGYQTKPKQEFDYSRLNLLKWMLLIAWWREYPDRFLMLARAPDANIDVAFLQSI